MPVTCTRRLEFDAAHRVMEHENKCRMLHGHRYAMEVTFTADNLDNLGRVVDFGSVREILGAWIDENWDHNTILHEKDSALGEQIARQTGQKIYYLPYNPTAENLTLYIHKEIIPKLFTASGLVCTRVKLWETPNCSAESTY